MIVVAGEALVDLVIGADGSVVAALGGGPFNVARTIGRLGGDAAFLGGVSDDRFGSRIHDQLADDAVRLELVSRTELPTTLAAAELDDDGAATYRFYIAGTAATQVTEVPTITEPLAAVHVGTLGLVIEPMAGTLERFVAGLDADVLVMLDPNCRPTIIPDRRQYLDRIDRVVRSSHVIKISTDDAVYLAPQIQPVELARHFLQQGVLAVLVTAGGDDTIVVTAAGEATVAVPPVVIADTIGAGDSFGGGFLTAWLTAGHRIDDLEHLDLVVAATEAAQLVAASTCSRPGADPPWLRQLPHGWPITADSR